MEHTKAILLHVLPFQDTSAILTAFTENKGLLKFFQRGYGRQKVPKAPLTLLEIAFDIGKSTLYRSFSLSTLESYPHLRSDLSLLESAGRMGRTILLSQQMEHPSPKLFSLLETLFQNLTIEDPSKIAAMFEMKILYHDGLFGFAKRCTLCNAPAFSYYGHDAFCKTHSLKGHITFTYKEKHALSSLAHATSLRCAHRVPCDKILNEKSKLWFNSFYTK